MKIRKDDYKKLSELINNTMDNFNIKAHKDYPAASLTRYLWDIKWTAQDHFQHTNDVKNYLFMRSLSDYLNDDHITTALKHIIKIRDTNNE